MSPFRAILRYEASHSIPSGWINTAISLTAPNGQWQLLERGEVPLDDTWFAKWSQDIASPRPGAWEAFWLRKNPDKSKADVPAPPKVDTKGLFWEMMTEARSPDPHIYPLLCRLRAYARAQKERGETPIIIAALSNAVIYPTGIRNTKGEEFDQRLQFPAAVPVQKDAVATSGADPRLLASYFDIFLHSAHIGLRKPEPEVYKFSVAKLDEVARQRGDSKGLKASDIVFLDDIGANLKEARVQGIRTVKVRLDHTEDAVKEVEAILSQDKLWRARL